MVIDTSAIVAIALNEPEALAFEECIADAPLRLISAATQRPCAGTSPRGR
jgi:ribonuclease VapC